jgi:hypothetical protein
MERVGCRLNVSAASVRSMNEARQSVEHAREHDHRHVTDGNTSLSGTASPSTPR